jgi:hypothetical protein
VGTLRPIPPTHCLACGEVIEEPLLSLGSIRCHDCRDVHRPVDPKLFSEVLGVAEPPRVNGFHHHTPVPAPPVAATSGPTPVSVQVRVSDPELAPGLIEFLRRRACFAERLRADLVLVQPHPTLREEHVRAELELLLGVWLSEHVGATAVLD